MIKKFRNVILVAVAALALGVPLLVPALGGVAGADTISDNLCKGTNQAAGSTGGCGTAGTAGSTDLSGIASKIVTIFSIIVGVVAVIMIIYGGFKYITSGGDSNNVSAAKNTLIYAIIGLIIVALAQIIVHYVINTATTATSGVN